MNNRLAILCAIGLCMSEAQAQSSVTLYGLLDTGVTYVDRVAVAGGGSGRMWSVHPGAMQASRWGLRGNEDLGGGLKALFVLEGGINVDTGTAAQGGLPWGRRVVVGIESKYGVVLAGRQPDFLDDMGSMTSTIDFGSQVALIHGLDRTYTQRTNNSIRFNSQQFGGASFTALIGLGENTATFNAGSARGLGANYVNGGLRLAAGYYESRLGTGTAASSADAGYASIGAVPGAPGVVGSAGSVALRTYTLASTYQWGPARLHASYSQFKQPLAAAGGARAINSSSNSKTQVLDVGASYAVTPLLFVSASVIHDHLDFVGAAKGSLTQYNVGADYFLSKRTDVYANAGHQKSSDMNTAGLESAPGGSRSQLLARVGIRHKF